MWTDDVPSELPSVVQPELPAARPATGLSSLGIQMTGNLPALFAALAKAQAALQPAMKNGANPAFKRDGGPSKYADLAAVMDVVQAAYCPQGLSVVQCPSVVGPQVSVTTLITHAEGGLLASTLSARAASEMPQAIGSATTYLRRYGLQAMCAVVAEEDDDGNRGSGTVTPLAAARQERAERPAAKPNPVEVQRRSQVEALREALDQAANRKAARALWADKASFLATLPPMTQTWFAERYQARFGEAPPTAAELASQVGLGPAEPTS